MARRVVNITIDAEGRDKGKVFVLTEMSAAQAEKWALRVLFAMGRAGVEIPDEIAAAGLWGVAMMGVKALLGIPFELAEPLMDEMFQCVACMPDASHPGVIRALETDDIEEVMTRVQLREALIALHTGFSLAAGISRVKAALLTTADGSSLNTPTSPDPLAG